MREHPWRRILGELPSQASFCVTFNGSQILLCMISASKWGMSAERSEIARDKLLDLLYKNPRLWVKVFSRVDESTFNKYLDEGGLAILEYPKGITTEEQWDKEITIRLNKIKGTEGEMALVNKLKSYLMKGK